MSTSSSIPVLNDVLFYTPDDPYNLDTNLRHIATSLVGIGYGEHTSVSGGLLTPGRAVELLVSGLIRYPIAQTAQLANTGKKPVIGIVIGSTEAGLNRIVWASDHLDLESVGLDGILSNPDSDLLLVADCNDDPITAGKIKAVASPSSSQIVIGKVKTYPYVTISSYSTVADSVSAAAHTTKANHHNLYGFTRMRNLLAVIDIGQTPIQYTKETLYQSDLGQGLNNPMSAMLNSDRSQIVVDPKVATYDSTFSKKIIKERYYQFKTVATKSDIVGGSEWPAKAYPLHLGGSGSVNYENYELTPNLSSPDYTTQLDLFKSFTVEKYYQYIKTSYNNPILYGKLAVTATVFNPEGISDLGGELGRIIIWDFYEYDATSGFEKVKHRVISTGPSADSLFTDTTMFPEQLVNLQ